MQTRKIGPFEVSAIGLGAMGLSSGYGPPAPRERAEEVLLGALDAGYTFFDTAAAYGLGHNEILLGEVLGPHRDKFTLASKCGMTTAGGGGRGINGDPKNLKATCEESLRNLKTDVIDLYYLHRWDKRVPIEESVGALGELVAEGKVRTIGLSEVSAQTLRRAHATFPITALQSEYSPWTRNPEIATLDACRELGIAFVAFSPVGRGLLAGNLKPDSVFETADIRFNMPRFNGEAFKENLELFGDFAGLAHAVGCTPAQLCLAWLLQKDPIIVPIPGTANPDHMRENAAAAQVQIAPVLVHCLESLLTPTTPVGGRYASPMQSSVDTERFEHEQ